MAPKEKRNPGQGQGRNLRKDSREGRRRVQRIAAVSSLSGAGGRTGGFSYSALSFSLPDSSPKIGKQQLPSRNWSFTRCPSAPTLGKDPAHARKASASGFLRKLLSYLGKSRPRQKQVGEHVAWEESAFNAGIVASRHSSSKWAWQVVESTEYYSKRDSSKGAKPVTADADGTEWRVGTNRKARERFSTSILAETGKIKGMNIQIVNSPPSPKLRRKGAEYRWEVNHGACLIDTHSFSVWEFDLVLLFLCEDRLLFIALRGKCEIDLGEEESGSPRALSSFMEEKEYGSDPQDGEDATNKYSELEARLKALESANVLTPGAAAMWLIPDVVIPEK
ncbi:hypothetical protein Salat_2982200 [Sesamum alatum]|uniref:Uncharacterized protein n=1 Tax=Sesamum alatum TaxID=300844 RepID=A0AAE1XHH7_9LAMI|nr:hypothetical protein Salat_2979000 [Sesamum alatum]KAK4412306.1 hypothetical protein Salat_2982200 [Sesamum alatum]